MSVVVPVYNAAATLASAIESTLAQSFEAFELILIDDGSTDDSASIARQYARRDRRIRTIRAGRRGLVGALNLGCKSALAPYIARMDADDLMLPRRLERQWQTMQADPQLAVLGCQVEAFPQQHISDGLARYLTWQNQCVTAFDIGAQMYRESPLSHPSVMMRRSLLNAIGLYRDGGFPEDYELWLRMHAAGYKLGKLDTVLLKWREHPQRATHTDDRYSDQAFSEIRATYLVQDPRLAEPWVVWGAGRRTRQRLMPLLQRIGPPAAWIDVDRKKIGQKADDAPIVSPEWLLKNNTKMILAAVRNHGAMERIAVWLEQRQFHVGTDWLPIG